MKKITIIAALLGATYFSNAQVGIGTSEPSSSSQLDVVSADKGVLIPRIALRSTTEFGPLVGDPVESLLVYNTQSVADVTPGFYFWQAAKWERVVNQSQLTDLVGDMANLRNLVNYIVPTNPEAPTTGGPAHTSVVYNPTTQEFSFVTYENGAYTSTPIDLSGLVAAAETKTFVRKVEDAATGVVTYHYFNEEAIADWLAANSANTINNIPNADGLGIEVTADIVNNFEQILSLSTTYEGNSTTIQEIIQQLASEAEGNVIYTNLGDSTNPNWVFQYWNGTQYLTISLNDIVAAAESKTSIVRFQNQHYYLSEAYIQGGGSTDVSTWTTAPAGTILIDVVADVAFNIQEILDTVINITEGTRTFTTVEQYLQYIATLSEGNVIYTNIGDAATPNWVFQYWDGTQYQTITISDLVTASETKTTMERKGTAGTYAQVIAEPTVDADVVYRYNAENVTNYINVTADILESITNNENIQNVISNILNAGGNVYYGDHDANAATENVFYTIDPATQVKTPIDISGVVVNAIVNASTTQLQEVKNVLGDTYSETTVVNTGDTWIDGGKVYKGIYAATVTGGTANVSAITITPPTGTTLGDVISIKILNAATNSIINTSTTDVAVAGTSLTFKIGTGNMYNVLSATNLNIKVLVEFSAVN